MKIMVFLQGTSIMHSSAVGKTRVERVRQVVDGGESILNIASYVPVGGAVRKLQAWARQGAELVYLSSNTRLEDVEKDKTVLRNHGFPDGPVLHRHAGEEYADVAASILPDILIEDDCESIGGEPEMTYPHLPPELQASIKSIAVREFGGIDHLPDDLRDLLDFPSPG